jgi:tetratricopeptide (TPR) repeat protein
MNHIAYFLKNIHFQKKTGQLDFQYEAVQKHLIFQNGGLLFAKTTLPEERMGDILLKNGKISKDVYLSIPRMIRPGQMIGENLVQKKIISQRDLYDGLMAQMSVIALSMFSHFNAEIVFREHDRFLDQDFGFKMSLPLIIEQGIRGMKFHPSLRTFLEDKILVLKETTHVPLLTAPEKKLLNRVDGKSVAKAYLASQTLAPQEFWKALYLFYCLNAVDFLETGKAEPTSKGKENLQARIDEVLELKKKLPELDFYQLLGVSRQTSEADIKKAYFKLARKYHPDLFGRNLPPSVKDQIDEVFDHITKAYRSLADKDQKVSYAAKSAGGGREEEKDKSKNAEIRFRQGKTLFNQGRYEESLALLEEAVRLKDDKGDYYLLLAMAESKIPSFSKKAERDFLKAIEFEPWNPEGWVGLGCLYKKEGLLMRAKKQFEKALEIDADHKVARQELKTLSEKGDQKKKGIWQKDLFGSKKK